MAEKRRAIQALFNDVLADVKGKGCPQKTRLSLLF